MFTFNNNHIFTGYLKQFLSTYNLPTCKVYTREFEHYFDLNKKEDPRLIESIDTFADNSRYATRINYIKDNAIYNYFWNGKPEDKPYWKINSKVNFVPGRKIPGFTKTLVSPGCVYDKTTHEYLGEYLRFLRDFHNINLMSLYNCFNNEICNNLLLNIDDVVKDGKASTPITFNSQDSLYKIYAIPVRLFEKYSIAVDSNQGIEICCGLYNTKLTESKKSEDLIKKTYRKYRKTIFNQPIIYDGLCIDYWNRDLEEQIVAEGKKVYQDKNLISRWDIANREDDLKLFIKIPTSCHSSIVILEGDFKHFNDFSFNPDSRGQLTYINNTCKSNFKKDDIDFFDKSFKPISKLQLLALNTGSSYPFADRLVEYLTGSAVTPLDEIGDNIRRVQKVMSQNGHYFAIEGVWEDKIQKIAYDYLTSSGPFEASKSDKSVVKDKRQGYHPKMGYTHKTDMYDILGYIDKDLEKCYASWQNDEGKATPTTIQNVDIYNKLYDI